MESGLTRKSLFSLNEIGGLVPGCFADNCECIDGLVEVTVFDPAKVLAPPKCDLGGTFAVIDVPRTPPVSTRRLTYNSARSGWPPGVALGLRGWESAVAEGVGLL